MARRSMRCLWTLALAASTLVSMMTMVVAECPNACSGKGKCGAFDMCICYEGFMGNDCSERICPFARAHVDSAKGDLNMDGYVDYSTVVLNSQMYRSGTSELFPIMSDASGVTVSDDTAHEYAECANKGLCERSSGLCSCFVGYEGPACQRASCPNSCSGHGVCLTNRERAYKDSDNLYELWDADAIMSCDCDKGYTDFDCSKRKCPYGIDPLYVDDGNTARVNEVTVLLKDFFDITAATGTYRLKFYDVFGEDWITTPLSVENVTENGCAEVRSALYALPQSVVSSVGCSVSKSESNREAAIALTFASNPGKLAIPEVIVTDEVGRDTTFDSTYASAGRVLEAYVYDTGVTGEFVDYFPTDCGVTVTVAEAAFESKPVVNSGSGLVGEWGNATQWPVVYSKVIPTVTLTDGTTAKLKKCLGDSNGVTGDDVGVELFDWGSVIVKVDSSYQTGFYYRWNKYTITGAGTSLVSSYDNTGSDSFDYTENDVSFFSVTGKNPHYVRLVSTSAPDTTSGGVFAVMYFGGYSNSTDEAVSGEGFQLTTAVDLDDYYVYSTDGVLERVWADRDLDGEFDIQQDSMATAYFAQYDNVVYTERDYSCDNAGTQGASEVFVNGTNTNCLQKGDLLVIPSSTWGDKSTNTSTAVNITGAWFDDFGTVEAAETAQDNAHSANYYTIAKISAEDYTSSTNTTEDRFQIVLDRPIFWDGSFLSQQIHPDLSSRRRREGQAHGIVQFFKFTPPDDGGVNYVSECAGRGICQEALGLCECFPGSTNHNCDTQSALAI